MGLCRHQERECEEEGRKELILLTQTAVGRISHWLGVVLLSASIISGLYMTHPFIPAFPYRWVRFTHLTVSGMLSALVLGRAYFALVSGDIRNFMFHRGDFRRFLHLIAYYLFLIKEKPYESTKYNIGQRFIYVSWFFLWFFQGVTGIILAGPSDSRLVLLSTYFGALQMIRLLHYFVTVYFVVTIISHIYLALTSDPAKLQAIFTGYVRVKDGKPEE